jgi:hypothetical protein
VSERIDDLRRDLERLEDERAKAQSALEQVEEERGAAASRAESAAKDAERARDALED